MLLAQWKSPMDILHCCRIVNGIKNKNMKNSLGATHCPKDKNRSPFHGEKPLMIK